MYVFNYVSKVRTLSAKNFVHWHSISYIARTQLYCCLAHTVTLTAGIIGGTAILLFIRLR